MEVASHICLRVQNPWSTVVLLGKGQGDGCSVAPRRPSRIWFLHTLQSVGEGSLAASSEDGPPVPAGREGLASMSKSPSTIAIERDRPLLTDLEPLQYSVWILLGLLGHGIS